ncbi:PREDICTED: flagellar attachment zone protein 1-like [Ipomoea nil]|uniref:flagellar attachment zone protein 1-like n=1 Tax=Ipomoea nil TaxID=35883 RepID=UPI000901504E|nr:PREDICTED: flagellar attachment zone protein 1-like [Ipomoea nil]
MFKSARWRSEKNKIRVVFKLQFYATQVTGDALMISVVPADVGKPTLKLEKAVVHNGSCYWENAVYETVKFNRDQKSGKIHERIYNFVVGTGSLKAGVVGEASIDLSSYAEATKVSYVSLPLKNSKSGAILHVSIKRVQDSTVQSTIVESEHAKLNLQDRTFKPQFSNVDMDDGGLKTNSVDETPLNKTVSHVPTLNGRTESSESDTTLSSSESSLGLDTPREVEMKKSNVHENGVSSLSSLNNGLVPPRPVTDVPVIQDHQKSQWEWLGGSVLEVSTDGSLNNPTEALLEASENDSDVVEKLRSELTALARQADLSELELQTLRKQIVKENKRAQDLSRETVNLKEERDKLKEECEKLKASQRDKDKKLCPDSKDVQDIVDELRQELNYQKEINANLQIQLQKTQESNSELILAVHDLDEMLEQKNKEIMNLSMICDDAVNLRVANSKHNITDHEDEEQKALEQLVRGHSDAKDVFLLEQKIMDIQREINICRRDKDELEMQMEQLALDYEILKQENHEMHYKLEQSQLQEQLKMQYECSSSYATVNELEGQIDGLEDELKKQSKEFSDSLVTINKLEAQIEGLEDELKKQSKEFSDSLLTITKLEAYAKSLEEELEIQAQGFETDLEALTLAKVEQEKRAICAEEELRKTRWQNANTAERLQMEFKRLSHQMASSFEANEKIATKALTEANELRLQKRHLEEMLQKSSEELQSVREHYEAMLHELPYQVIMMLGSEINEESMQLENVEKCTENLSEQMLMLKAEIEKLVADTKVLPEYAKKCESLTAELENTRKSMKEMELMLEQGNGERTELENRLASVQKEAEESLKEKETLVRKLQEEMDVLRIECSELRSSLFEDELEKERLRKHMLHLKGDLKKKDDALSSLDMNLKDANNRAKTVASLKEKIKLLEDQITLKENALETSCNAFLETEKDLQTKIEELSQNTARSCKLPSAKVATEALSVNSGTTEQVKSSSSLSDEEMKASVSSAKDTDKLLNEVALLKEKNTSMEGELKEMQQRYSEISLKFAEVEGERQQLVMKLRNRKNAQKSLALSSQAPLL